MRVGAHWGRPLRWALLAAAAVLPAQECNPDSQVQARRVDLGETARGKESKVAVLVGINRYERTGMLPLKYAVADMQAVSVALRRLGFHVISRDDTSATRSLICAALEEARGLVDPAGGTLLFYFSGHGFGVKTDRGLENYLVPYGVTKAQVVGQGLPLREVGRQLLLSRAPKLLMMVDACRNQPARSAVPADEADFSPLSMPGVPTLYATDFGLLSYEDEGLRQGIFTHYLANGLCGGAASGNDGVITVTGLYEYLSGRVEEHSKTSGLVQIPILKYEGQRIELGNAEVSTLVLAASEEDEVAIKPAGSSCLAYGLVKLQGGKEITLQVAPGKNTVRSLPSGDAAEVETPAFRTVKLAWPRLKEVALYPTVAVPGTSIEMGALLVRNRHLRRLGENAPDDDQPAARVPWAKAQEYCEALGKARNARFRLPTEAEWEAAAKNGPADFKRDWDNGFGEWCGDGARVAGALEFPGVRVVRGPAALRRTATDSYAGEKISFRCVRELPSQ